MFPIFTPANQGVIENKNKAQSNSSPRNVHHCRVSSLRKLKNKAHPIHSPRNGHNHQHHPPTSQGIPKGIYQHFSVITPPDKDLTSRKSESSGKGPPKLSLKIGEFSKIV